MYRMDFFHIYVYLVVSFSVLALVSEGEAVSAYLSTDQLTWLEAKEYCQMVALEKNVNISSPYTGLSWVDVTGYYSSWVEYLGVFVLNEEKITARHDFFNGTTLLDCLESCHDYNFIGLQTMQCVCLANIVIDTSSITQICTGEFSTKCVHDDEAFCAITDPSKLRFAVYKKVNVNPVANRVPTSSECLAVKWSKRQSKTYPSYYALDCLVQHFCICLYDIGQKEYYGQKNTKNNWIESFSGCNGRPLAGFSEINTPLDMNVSYWLANSRRLVKQYPPSEDREFCMAAYVLPSGTTKLIPEHCDRRLPALCSWSTSRDISKEDEGTTINGYLVIVLIVVSVITVAISVVIIVFYIRLRKRNSNARHSPFDSSKDVVYAAVNKPTRLPAEQEQSIKQKIGQSHSDEIYDHTDHNRLSKNQSPDESNYDTMQGTGIEDESNYDLANQLDNEQHFVVDDSAEYSHVEVTMHDKI